METHIILVFTIPGRWYLIKWRLTLQNPLSPSSNIGDPTGKGTSGHILRLPGCCAQYSPDMHCLSKKICPVVLSGFSILLYICGDWENDIDVFGDVNRTVLHCHLFCFSFLSKVEINSNLAFDGISFCRNIMLSYT